MSARSVRRPLIELIQQRSESRRLSRTGAVAQTAVILLAATALYQLLTGGLLSDQGSQLGLLAPALFALALAVIAVRVAVLVVRRVTTRPPRSIVALVVGRQAARTPTTMNPAIVIAAGVAMSIFASQVLGLSLRNQSLRADAVVGAVTVLHVGVPKGLDLAQTVRDADPGGRSAMAVQEKALSSDGGTSRIVAVDSSRLAAVSSWPTRWSGLSDTDLAGALKPPTQPAVILRGTKVAVRFADVRVDLAPPQAFAEVPPTEDSPPVLSLVVDLGSAWQTIYLASLTNDTRVAEAELPCPKGCRVVGLAVGSEPGHAYAAGFTVTGVSTDQQPAQTSGPWLQGSGRWQPRVGDQTDPEPISSATPRGTASGLQVKAFDWAGGNPTRVLVADVVDPMPALVAPDTTEQPFPGRESTALGTGLDGQAQLIKVVGHAAVLPRSLTDGVLVDLDNARRLVDPAANEAGSEVWLAPDAPPSIEQALTKAGLTIAGRERLSEELDRLDHQAMTRGALVAVTVGYAALALALLTLVAARLADAERRRSDWASLRDAGLDPRTVRWLAGVEIAGPALLGVVIGVLSGVVGIVLAAARLPLVDTATPGPPLDLRVDWSPIGTLVVFSALVVAAVAAIGAVAETRGGRR